jgi:hypothetical protein
MNASRELHRGIVYIVTGDPAYAAMCLASMASLRDWGYEDSVFIITDQADRPWPRDKTILHHIPAATSAQTSRYWKTQVGRISPFQRSIYLDCDILATSSLESMWQEVKPEGVGFVLDFYPTLHRALIMEYGRLIVPSETLRSFSLSEHCSTAEIAEIDGPYYNSGVFCWEHTDETINFFSHWHQEWKRFAQRDQFALARALKSSGVTVYRLPESYNFSSRRGSTLAKAMNQDVTFVHFWGEGHSKTFDLCAQQIRVFRVMDETTQKRVADACKTTVFPDRHLIMLLPLIIGHSPKDFFRFLFFLGLSIFSVVCTWSSHRRSDLGRVFRKIQASRIRQRQDKIKEGQG